jgi:hypothetical protein
MKEKDRRIEENDCVIRRVRDLQHIVLFHIYSKPKLQINQLLAKLCILSKPFDFCELSVFEF